MIRQRPLPRDVPAMTPYIVSSPAKDVVLAYARWRQLSEEPVATIMNDGWTLPSLHFEHLYEAHAASLDLAMISGSVNPFQPHDVLITEFRGTLWEAVR